MIDATGAVLQTAMVAKPDKHNPLWKAAQKLEQAFLSEMLKSAGVGVPRAEFGGGVGEEQFASYLRDAHAGAMVAGGGIGLSERLFAALEADSNGD